jgi:hypothetical protein
MIRLIDLDKMTFGITGIPVLICGLLIILIAIFKAIKISRSSNPGLIDLNAIWLIGLVSFLIRLLELIVNLGNMLDAMALAEDLNTSLVYRSFSNVAFYSVSSFIVLILSLIAWGSLKGLIRYKLSKLTKR